MLEELLDAVVEAEAYSDKLVEQAKAEAKEKADAALKAQDEAREREIELAKINRTARVVAGDAEGDKRANEILARARKQAEGLKARVDIAAEGKAVAAAFEEWYGRR